MRLHLTDIAVRTLKPSDRQYKVWDATFPGFGVRVNGGSKSWIVMHGRERALKVLGRYPDVSNILDGLLSKPSAANHAFAAMRGFFSWAVRRDLIENSPCDRLRSPANPVDRDRVLSEPELAKVLSQARSTPYPFGHILQLL